MRAFLMIVAIGAPMTVVNVPHAFTHRASDQFMTVSLGVGDAQAAP